MTSEIIYKNDNLKNGIDKLLDWDSSTGNICNPYLSSEGLFEEISLDSLNFNSKILKQNMNTFLSRASSLKEIATVDN